MWFKYEGYLLKDKCSLPTSVLLFPNQRVQAFLLHPGCGREAAVLHCKTSAGGLDKYTLNFDCDVKIAMFLPLHFLCE